ASVPLSIQKHSTAIRSHRAGGQGIHFDLAAMVWGDQLNRQRQGCRGFNWLPQTLANLNQLFSLAWSRQKIYLSCPTPCQYCCPFLITWITWLNPVAESLSSTA